MRSTTKSAYEEVIICRVTSSGLRARAILGGDWVGRRERDFLLAYKLADSAKHGLVVCVRAGTHAELIE